MILLILIILLANALRGYDCGDEGLNITSLSLVDMGNCDAEPVRAETYVQLMQLSDYDKTMAIQCKKSIEIYIIPTCQ